MKARQSKFAEKLFKNESQGRKILREIRRNAADDKSISTDVKLNKQKKLRIKEL